MKFSLIRKMRMFCGSNVMSQQNIWKVFYYLECFVCVRIYFICMSIGMFLANPFGNTGVFTFFHCNFNNFTKKKTLQNVYI